MAGTLHPADAAHPAAISDRVDLAVDLTFHTWDALDTALHEAGAPPAPRAAGRQEGAGWPILARLAEYAHADLDGLHLTGWTSGHLLSDFEQRVQALARHVDGTITAISQNAQNGHLRLSDGHVTTHHGEPTHADPPTPRQAAIGPAAPSSGREGRIELHVTHGLPQVLAVPWITAHLDELRPLSAQAGFLSLTGATGLELDRLPQDARFAAWQAFCNADTLTPHRWIAHHPGVGTVEAHHLDGQIVVPLTDPPTSHDAAHTAQVTHVLRPLDTRMLTDASVDPLAVTLDPTAGPPGPDHPDTAGRTCGPR